MRSRQKEQDIERGVLCQGHVQGGRSPLRCPLVPKGAFGRWRARCWTPARDASCVAVAVAAKCRGRKVPEVRAFLQGVQVLLGEELDHFEFFILHCIKMQRHAPVSDLRVSHEVAC
jgi:hypothetical protein